MATMQAFSAKLSSFRLLLDTVDEAVNESPPFPSPQQISDYFITLWNTLIDCECHPLSIIYTITFLLYAYFTSVSILTTLTLTIIIFKSTNESMKIYRYAQLKYSLYDFIKIISQIIGDILTMPYHLLFTHSETPFLYFKPTPKNQFLFENLSHTFLSYFPTFYLKNPLFQFFIICLEETPLLWFFQKSKFHIKRECVTLSDNGLIALDWWCNPHLIDHSNQNGQHFSKCTYSDVTNSIQYKSKIYYTYTHKLYNQCFSDSNIYPMQDNTPILLVFPTFAGDSVSSPTRRICKYFVDRHWRVIVYVKRGCGSFTKAEFLPLTTLKPFCLHGQKDYDVVFDIIKQRYPFAPKVLMGLSGGGAYVQTILANEKYKDIFVGGIKIDSGMDFGSECADLDLRQPFIANILGQFWEVNVLKCRQRKCANNVLKMDKYFAKIRWNEILNYDSNKGLKGMLWSLEHLVCPCYGFEGDLEGYLEWSKPSDLREVKYPLLCLDTFNDFMRNVQHIKDGICEENENIFHIINDRGAHCIRREGILANKCYLSKVAFAFAEFVVRQQKTLLH